MNADPTGKILVVDDSKSARFSMRKQLEQSGYEVIEAESGEDAIACLMDNPVSLITLDVEMPNLDGYETCRLIRSISTPSANQEFNPAHTPVVFVTASDSVEGRVKGFEVGACDFLAKQSISSGELSLTVDRYLRPNKFLLGLRALIVEDSKLVQLMIEKCINGLGGITTRCSDGQQAYELLRDGHDHFDVIITDNNMPNMSGIELCSKTRKELGYRTIPIIFLSATSDRNNQLEFFKAGASDYLVKPFLREELESRLKVHLENAKRTSMLADLNLELERSNQALEHFASVAAHDLKSPLHSLRLSVKTFLSEYGSGLEPAAEKLLAISLRSATRMSGLIDGLLRYSRLGTVSTNFDTIDLNATFASLLEDLSGAIKATDASLHIQENLPTIFGDKDLIQELFQNLVGNSLKYVRQNVKPVISISAKEETREGSDWLVVSLQDNGIGFDDSQAEKMFGLFSRLVSAGEFEGLGIGLATCKKIVEAHNGVITAKGKPGEGATFTIRFPRITSRQEIAGIA